MSDIAPTPLPMRIVLDTNTVMALWVFEDPALAPLRLWLDSLTASLLAREDTLDELRHVLAYRQFALAATRQQSLHADYAARTTMVPPVPEAPEAAAALPLCRDRDDQKFLELARDGGATHLLSRDKALLKLRRHRLVRERFVVQTPEAFIAEHAAVLAATRPA